MAFLDFRHKAFNAMVAKKASAGSLCTFATTVASIAIKKFSRANPRSSEIDTLPTATQVNRKNAKMPLALCKLLISK
jgi:hypothetical protein